MVIERKEINEKRGKGNEKDSKSERSKKGIERGGESQNMKSKSDV